MYALDQDTIDVSYDVGKDTTLVMNSEVIILIDPGATYIVIPPSFVYKLVKDLNTYTFGHNADS